MRPTATASVRVETSEKQDKLKAIAQEIVNPQASVKWELRLYQRDSDDNWTRHQCWML